MKKLTIDFVREKFENENYILLSSEYTGAFGKLNYICSNGHVHNISWNQWQQGKRCPYCCGNARLTIDFIKSELTKENYILLTTEYINNRQKLEYICPSGHKYSTCWDDWNRGKRCKMCDNINRFGSGNHQWRGGISNLPYCHNWTKEYKEEIKKRDYYQCLNPYCFDIDSRLVVHHIDYTKTICGPNNLITVCGSCNSRANFDREWHTEWYRTILNKRYGYMY